jgi:chromosome segregation ATPase
MSVSFSSDPKKRYQLFLKATQIDAIIEKLNDCNEHYTSAKHQLEYQKKGIDQLKKDLAAIEDKYMKMKSVETLKVSIGAACYTADQGLSFSFFISRPIWRLTKTS